MSAMPNALVIGPMKAGTSWIHNYLEVRGDIGLPRGVKETFFFDRHFDRGQQWYANHFSHASIDDQAIIEVAPSYFHCRQVPERVKATLGGISLVVTLRNPIRRSWSHYLHLRRYGYTKLPLRDAVAAFPEILEASRYKTCLTRWEAVFGRENIHVLWQEDLGQAASAYTRHVCNGLGIAFVPLTDELRSSQNEAALPASATLAALGDRTAHFLRSYRLYGVVNIAKRLGLKQLFFGKPGSGSLPHLSAEDADWLADLLIDEMPEWTLAERLEIGGAQNE